MKIPLTKYGWPQVVVYPAIILAVMILIALSAIKLFSIITILIIEFILLLVLVWALAFFRDPFRECPTDENLLLSPADGKITEIANIDENEYLGGPAIKIGIFLSIFNVHINRVPCSVQVKKITHKKGQYKNALNPESGQVNESNELQLQRIAEPDDKLIVKQVSGAIARRIVCKTKPGDKLNSGEQFGMIKFGSRTELFIPVPETEASDEQKGSKQDYYKVICLVKTGDKVKAGITPLVRYEKCLK